MTTFPYGAEEIAHLTERDPILGAYIEKTGPLARRTYTDPFSTLIHSIVGQQISTKAHESVWARFRAQVGTVTPQQIITHSFDDLRACGLSGRKTEYILEASRRIASGEIDFYGAITQDDSTVIETLTALRGVGKWTVEMLLIFSLLRRNVISYDDLAIRRGICWLYGLDSLDKAHFATLKARYSPYASVASIYLWHRSAN